MSNPRIESDDCGTRLIVDTSGLDFDQLTQSRTYITVPIDDALAFYEHVDREIGEWAREGMRARAAVARGVTLNEYVGRESGAEDGCFCDISDGGCVNYPDCPGGPEALREAGDHLRKARRENG